MPGRPRRRSPSQVANAAPAELPAEGKELSPAPAPAAPATYIKNEKLLREVPVFRGFDDPHGWRAWSWKLFTVARLAGWSEEAKFEVAVLKFTGRVPEAFIRKFLEDAKKDGRTPTWSEFEVEAIKYFWVPAEPRHYLDRLRGYRRAQGETVSAYHISFGELLHQIREAAVRHYGPDAASGYLPSEEVQVDLFLAGLNNRTLEENTRRELRREGEKTLAAAFRVAQVEEMTLTRGQPHTQERRGHGAFVACNVDEPADGRDPPSGGAALAGTTRAEPSMHVRVSNLPVGEEYTQFIRDVARASAAEAVRQSSPPAPEEKKQKKERKVRFDDEEVRQAREECLAARPPGSHLTGQVGEADVRAADKYVKHLALAQRLSKVEKSNARLKRRLARKVLPPTDDEEEESESGDVDDDVPIADFAPRKKTKKTQQRPIATRHSDRVRKRKEAEAAAKAKSKRLEDLETRVAALASAAAAGNGATAPPGQGRMAGGENYRDSRACYRCGEVGHISRDCRLPPVPRAHPTFRCYNCGEVGHMSRYCKQPPRTSGSRFPRETRRGNYGRPGGPEQPKEWCTSCKRHHRTKADCPYHADRLAGLGLQLQQLPSAPPNSVSREGMQMVQDAAGRSAPGQTSVTVEALQAMQRTQKAMLSAITQLGQQGTQILPSGAPSGAGEGARH